MILRSPLAWLHRLRATPRSTELEVTAHPRRYAIEQPSFLEDPQRVGVGGRIGGRRPGTHHGRRAADHIRENQTDEPRAARPTRESTALQPREMLADGIDLGNRRAGAQ